MIETDICEVNTLLKLDTLISQFERENGVDTGVLIRCGEEAFMIILSMISLKAIEDELGDTIESLDTISDVMVLEDSTYEGTRVTLEPLSSG